MTHIAAPQDTIRITAESVMLLNSAFVQQPVIADLTGTVQLEEWDSGTAEGSEVPITLHNRNDWYADIEAPRDEGSYRIVVTLEAGGARRTLHGKLDVQAPPT